MRISVVLLITVSLLLLLVAFTACRPKERIEDDTVPADTAALVDSVATIGNLPPQGEASMAESEGDIKKDPKTDKQTTLPNH